MIRAIPISAGLAEVDEVDGYVRYVPLQYQHCFIDLAIGFEAYKGKFSSKTRSTINRKLRKFQEHCGGSLQWRSYRTPEELRDFHGIARTLSAKTYQERLLDAGIPVDGDFVDGMLRLAAQDRVRAYVLFDRGSAVSYLYCPARGNALVYAYLGYDPAYGKHSVGTVLQWLALEEVFAERRFSYFDFTEGESEHKRLFATHERRCANVFFLKRSIRNRSVVRAHWLINRFSSLVGRTADRLGVRSLLRRIMRFGLAGAR